MIYFNIFLFVFNLQLNVIFVLSLTARLNGFVVFSRTWPNGAQGKLYFPTDVKAVRVRFPQAVKDTNVSLTMEGKFMSSALSIHLLNKLCPLQ